MNRFRKASRLRKIQPSGIRRLFTLAHAMPSVIDLGIGEPDFVPPPHVLEAVKQALDRGKTHYTSTTGIAELREALANKAKREYGLTYNPETEILVTVGATQAFSLALMALANPHDEVLVPDPGFVCYQPSVLIASGTPVSMPTLEENDFKLNADVVMSHVTDKSRIMVVNSPNNPTGAVFSYDDLASLSKLAVERDLVVISDEVYEQITYDRTRHHCLASFPEMRERTLVIGSFSKTYAMTGFRIGYVLGPEELVSSIMLAHQFSVACVSGPAQYAAVAALGGPQSFVRDMVAEFDRRRKFLCGRLNEIQGFSCKLPKGAFYAFANVKEFGGSSAGLVSFLFSKGKVVTVSGSAFGKYGEGYLRFSYSTAYEKIEEALNRIERVAKDYKSEKHLV